MGAHGRFFFACTSGAITGALIDRVVYRPLRRRNAPALTLLVASLVFLLASFGAFIFLQNLVQVLAGGAEVLSLRSDIEQSALWSAFGGRLQAAVTRTQIIIVVVAWALAATGWAIVKFTQVGKAMRAVADDPLGANIVGIDSNRVIRSSFVLGSALAGAAGMLISLETNLEPTMGLNAVMKAIIACIVGGVGSVPGAMVGGIFLGIIENLSVFAIASQWKDTVAFAILIGFLVLRPAGILGGAEDGRR